MEQISIKTEKLSPNLEYEGLDLSGQRANISKFYNIPMALANVDERFKTTTFRDVVKAAAPYLEVLVDGKNVQVLDPKSNYVSDEEFEQLPDIVEKVTGSKPEVQKKGFQSLMSVKLAEQESDNYLGDMFSRNLVITRKPEGGIQLNTNLLRLVCTNGMVVPEPTHNVLLRTVLPSNDNLGSLFEAVSNFSVEEYLNSLFTQDGQPVPCYLSDMIEMHKCLGDLTDTDYADLLFPVKQVEEFYNAQGIETKKLNRTYKSKLPTGLSYYQSLQILTNGAKAMSEPTVENKLRVSSFCTRRRMKNMKSVDLHWNGAPEFSQSQIHSWMGDR